ncbi:hypothetical protein LINGRAHAP2_LOCUS21126 [Linum grandiflorum]
MSSTAFSRGAQTMNVMFKPVVRKGYHKKSSGDTLSGREKAAKAESTEDARSRGGCSSCWVPHDKTGIYYPKGQEDVMEGIPVGAAKYADEVHWYSDNYHKNHSF